jgi:hypothetical protein
MWAKPLLIGDLGQMLMIQVGVWSMADPIIRWRRP